MVQQQQQQYPHHHPHDTMTTQHVIRKTMTSVMIVSSMLLVVMKSTTPILPVCQSFGLESPGMNRNHNRRSSGGMMMIGILERQQQQQQGNNHCVTTIDTQLWGSSDSSSSTSSVEEEVTIDIDPLERAKRQFEQMTTTGSTYSNDDDNGATTVNTNNGGYDESDSDALYQEFISYSANALKAQLKSYNVPAKGRKPDMAKRLVEYVLSQRRLQQGGDSEGDSESDGEMDEVTNNQSEMKLETSSDVISSSTTEPTNDLAVTDHSNETSTKPKSKPPKKSPAKSPPPLKSPPTSQNQNNFASLRLSPTASTALTAAKFHSPTPIQSIALPLLTTQRQSLILHAETGSGKTLTYLLPITERMWNERGGRGARDDGGRRYALILTPTRELAAQVAGVATVLAPPNSVRLIPHPTNVVRGSAEGKERSEGEYGGRFDFDGEDGSGGLKLIVGSAKTVMLSLFGDDTLAGSPTSKPEAKMFMKGVEYLVLDEVDRMLDIKTTRASKLKSKYYKKHDRPAAILASSIARLTLGRAQIVAASATVGRPLKREYARVLGLLPKECPQVIRGEDLEEGSGDDGEVGVMRTNTLPKSLTHYVMPCDGSTGGGMLTVAAFLVKGMQAAIPTTATTTATTNERRLQKKILFVITKNCGISVKHALGAMGSFNVEPRPQSLLDLLEGAEGTDGLMGVHKEVCGVTGLGESSLSISPSSSSSSTASNTESDEEGYILVTGEDSVRGLHLDGLDSVIVVGRPQTPDSYIHIAGRAGRAGKKGDVVTIVSYEQGSSLTSWENMLGVGFVPLDEGDASGIQ